LLLYGQYLQAVIGPPYIASGKLCSRGYCVLCQT
jgi:hypothetical protein